MDMFRKKSFFVFRRLASLVITAMLLSYISASMLSANRSTRPSTSFW